MKSKYRPGTYILVPSKYRLQEIDAIGQSVFMWLCAHANNKGLCFPSIKRLLKLCRVSRNTVKDRIRKLESMGLIKKNIRKKENGENNSNLYQIIEDDWIPPKNGGSINNPPRSLNNSVVDQQMATNEIQSKLNLHNQNIYIVPDSKKTETIEYLKNISEDDVIKLAERYEVSDIFVRDNVENVMLYCTSTGKEYKNYKATLIRFIKTKKEGAKEREKTKEKEYRTRQSGFSNPFKEKLADFRKKYGQYNQ